MFVDDKASVRRQPDGINSGKFLNRQPAFKSLLPHRRRQPYGVDSGALPNLG
jgi:hypothetical protein